MCQGEKSSTSTLESSMVAELLIKVVPIKVKATDKLKNSPVLHTVRLHHQHQTSEAAVQRAPTIYSQIKSSPEESE